MDPLELKQIREKLVRETRGQYIVSSDPVKFMHKFLPFNERKDESYQKFISQKLSKTRIQHLKNMGNANTEKEMYSQFGKATSKWPFVRGDNTCMLYFNDAHDYRDTGSGIGPDYTIEGKVILPRRTKLKVDFANLISFVEFKLSALMDAFIDVDGKEYEKEKADSGSKDEDEDEDEDSIHDEEDAKEEQNNPDSAGLEEPFIAEDERPSERKPENPLEALKPPLTEPGTWQFMSANLTMNPSTASHGLLDDRESALHVLMYMAIRYLRHDQNDPTDLRIHLNMFDEYVVHGDRPAKGTRAKLTTITSNGPHIGFDIDAINELITELCEHFATRYIGPPRQRRIVPRTKAAKEAAEHTAREAQSRLEALNDPRWLYSLLRESIKLIPECLPHETDWVDNSAILRLVPKNTNGKRGRANDQWDVRRASKLW
ncbi:hypothetical protein EYR40_004691 [Pleurotus pulmonarius]|nr:hypothetical protein EYR40_004691 [Pleurotus pulmonarius]